MYHPWKLLIWVIFSVRNSESDDRIFRHWLESSVQNKLISKQTPTVREARQTEVYLLSWHLGRICEYWGHWRSISWITKDVGRFVEESTEIYSNNEGKEDRLRESPLSVSIIRKGDNQAITIEEDDEFDHQIEADLLHKKMFGRKQQESLDDVDIRDDLDLLSSRWVAYNALSKFDAGEVKLKTKLSQH